MSQIIVSLFAQLVESSNVMEGVSGTLKRQNKMVFLHTKHINCALAVLRLCCTVLAITLRYQLTVYLKYLPIDQYKSSL